MPKGVYDRNFRSDKSYAWKKARSVFTENNEGPPWACFLCGEEIHELGIGSDQGHIHHHDRDRENNSPDNLLIAHGDCHLIYHKLETPANPERIRKFVETMGSPEKREMRRLAALKQWANPETRAKHIAGNKAQDPESYVKA